MHSLVSPTCISTFHGSVNDPSLEIFSLYTFSLYSLPASCHPLVTCLSFRFLILPFLFTPSAVLCDFQASISVTFNTVTCRVTFRPSCCLPTFPEAQDTQDLAYTRVPVVFMPVTLCRVKQYRTFCILYTSKLYYALSSQLFLRCISP